MVNLTINGVAVQVAEGTTILAAARAAGVRIPTLCHFKEINEVGACRVCVVEVKGCERLVAACNTSVAEGMEIVTNTPRVLAARQANLQLILSEHDCHCPTCVRNGTCELQRLAHELNILEQPYETRLARNAWPKGLPLVRTDSKCVTCLRCVDVCEKVQGLGVWDLLGLGAHAHVGVRGGAKLTEASCALCGQCVTHCPTGALAARDDTARLLEAIRDPAKTVVLQVAPAVRAAWGEGLGLAPEQATERRLAAALRRLGVDYVFDTNFSADLTILEEGNELIEKLRHPETFRRPLFTSCCPGWVRFLKLEYPELVGQLSTAKSPQQMFGAVAKTYFAGKIGKEPADIFCVSVMPCLAKKWECGVAEVNDAGADRDVDLVLTTREVDRLLTRLGVDPAALAEEDFDSPLGTGTGAAVIFGATGGVMEAALRTAAFVLEGRNPAPDAFAAARGADGRRELAATLGGVKVKACVVSGLAGARRVVEEVRAGRADYDFVEVMACPGGCACGGGQPIASERRAARQGALYALDRANTLRFSHENPSVRALYDEFLGKPLGEKAHHLLHTDQRSWTMI